MQKRIAEIMLNGIIKEKTIEIVLESEDADAEGTNGGLCFDRRSSPKGKRENGHSGICC